MMTSGEQRTAQRFALRCPVEFEQGSGLSRDISGSGIYFFTAHPFRSHETVRLAIHPRHAPALRCDGQVVRTEPDALPKVTA